MIVPRALLRERSIISMSDFCFTAPQLNSVRPYRLIGIALLTFYITIYIAAIHCAGDACNFIERLRIVHTYTELRVR